MITYTKPKPSNFRKSFSIKGIRFLPIKHDSGIHCDELISLPKAMLTNYVGKLSPKKIELLERALKIALQLHDE